MISQACKKFHTIQSQTESDPEYQLLEQNRKELEPNFRKVVDSLESDQRDIIFQYLGILQEQELRTVEIACFIP